MEDHSKAPAQAAVDAMIKRAEAEKPPPSLMKPAVGHPTNSKVPLPKIVSSETTELLTTMKENAQAFSILRILPITKPG